MESGNPFLFSGVLSFLFKAVVISVIVIGCLMVLANKFQNNLLYIPVVQGVAKSSKENPRGYRHPSEHNLNCEDVEIVCEDGVKIRGWFFKSTDPNAFTVVYFHENAGNLGTRIPYLEAYTKMAKVNLLVVAYRGYSESEGEPTEQGLQKDGVAILSYVFSRTDIDTKKVVVHGRSLGGAVAIYSLSPDSKKTFPVAGVILENTFTSIPEMVAKLFPYVHVLKSYVLNNFWPSVDRISRINCPKLFISGLQDEIVPAVQMKELFQKASANKYIYEIPEGSHNVMWNNNPEEYFFMITKFFNKCQSTSEQAKK